MSEDDDGVQERFPANFTASSASKQTRVKIYIYCAPNVQDA